MNVEQSVYEESRGGGVVFPINATPPLISDVRIFDITADGAKISWSTNEVCLAELYYGENEAYEYGPLIDHSDSYEMFHNFALSGLKSGTTYYLRIKSENQNGAERILQDYSFNTLPEFNLPANVGSLLAVQKDKTIFLTWQNPSDEDFAGVLINRKIGSPSLDKNDGERIFDGSMESFIDSNVEQGKKYYYTAFSYNKANLFSTGVFVFVQVILPGEDSSDNQGPNDNPDVPVNTPEDVTSLETFFESGDESIRIFWVNPEKEDVEIEVRKQTGFPALTPYEGSLIYSGKENSFEDFDIKEGQIYYYSVFTKSKEGIYSKGQFIAAGIDEEINFEDTWEAMNFFDVGSGIELSLQNKNVAILSGRTLGFEYKIKTLPANVARAGIKVNKSFYLFTFDKEDLAYETSFVVPEEAGQYPMSFVFLDSGENIIYKKDIDLSIEPLGKISGIRYKNFSDLENLSDKFICFADRLLGTYSENCLIYENLDGAEIDVFREKQNGEWEFWDSATFFQQNPYFTGTSGSFGFSVPNGKYKLVIKKTGYEEKVVMLEAENNVINENIVLEMEKDLRYDIIIVVILLLFIIIFSSKRFFRKFRNKEI